jgi:hypothetical protein
MFSPIDYFVARKTVQQLGREQMSYAEQDVQTETPRTRPLARLWGQIAAFGSQAAPQPAQPNCDPLEAV